METIEKLAWEYVDAPCDQDCGNCDRWTSSCRFCLEVRSFIGGAKVQYQLLTRWHDPKEELPQEAKTVLIRVNGLELYKVGYYRPNKAHEYQWHTDDLSMPDSFVLGWREIHE